jgi:predicted enzyme related to lactoylglutathione lyase
VPPSVPYGKLTYLQLPATDIQRSAEFYRAVFGWRIRQRDDGSVAFEDSVNEVGGTWVLGRTPSSVPGVLISILVDDVAASAEAIVAAGGEIVQPIGGDAPEITARFSDPAGNVLGIFQQ